MGKKYQDQEGFWRHDQRGGRYYNSLATDANTNTVNKEERDIS